MLTISWGLVCNLFESVYLNWDPAKFAHNKAIRGWVNLLMLLSMRKLSSHFSLWQEHTVETGEHAGRLVSAVCVHLFTKHQLQITIIACDIPTRQQSLIRNRKKSGSC